LFPPPRPPYIVRLMKLPVSRVSWIVPLSVYSKVSIRRAVDAVQRCEVACVRADHQGLEMRHDAQAACEPGGRGVRISPCPSSPTTHPPYVPRPSAVDHLDETC
jgi:hypothetical protein